MNITYQPQPDKHYKLLGKFSYGWMSLREFSTVEEAEAFKATRPDVTEWVIQNEQGREVV